MLKHECMILTRSCLFKPDINMGRSEVASFIIHSKTMYRAALELTTAVSEHVNQLLNE